MTSRKSLSQIAPRGARIPLKALCLITCFVLILFAGFASAQSSPIYGDQPNACQNLAAWHPHIRPATLYRRVRRSSEWISSVSIRPISGTPTSPTRHVDPNSTAIMAVMAGRQAYIVPLESRPTDSGIPYIVVDSTQTPTVPISVIRQWRCAAFVHLQPKRCGCSSVSRRGYRPHRRR